MKNNLISRRSVLGGTAAAGLYGLTGPRAYAAEVNWKNCCRNMPPNSPS
jgi:hypothetical protein